MALIVYASRNNSQLCTPSRIDAIFRETRRTRICEEYVGAGDQLRGVAGLLFGQNISRKPAALAKDMMGIQQKKPSSTGKLKRWTRYACLMLRIQMSPHL